MATIANALRPRKALRNRPRSRRRPRPREVGWGGRVLSYCACWELHLRGRLKMLVGRFVLLRNPADRKPTAPGGEPLYKMAALSVGSRRLPGMTQRNVLPIASVPCSG
jgi:hypothetical protein